VQKNEKIGYIQKIYPKVGYIMLEYFIALP